MQKQLQQSIRAFAETISLNRGRAYFVGGYVRDQLLGIESKDIDIEVHGIEPKALRTIVESHFKQVEEQGVAFGVLKVYYELRMTNDELPEGSLNPQSTIQHSQSTSIEIDISLPRTDSKVAPGHTGFDVRVDPHMGLEAAAQRRDFTMNTLMQDILTGNIEDPFHGRVDLEARVLRAVDPDLFGDDPLRVLRGVQFVARFGLTVAPDTLELMRSMAPRLAELSADRQRAEWYKLFVKADQPSRGLQLAYDLGLFTGDLEVLARMAETEQDPVWHPEGTVWAHTIWGADETVLLCKREGLSNEERLMLQLGNLLHDLGKVDVTSAKEGRVHSKGHQEAGQVYIKPVLATFGMQRHVAACAAMMRFHHHPMWWYENRELVSDGQVRRVARQIKPLTMRLLSYVTEIDLRSRGPYPEGMEDARLPEIAEWFRGEAERLGVLDSAPTDVIRGHDLLKLGLKPGPQFGVLVRVANRLHDERGMDRETILAAFAVSEQLSGREEELYEQFAT